MAKYMADVNGTLTEIQPVATSAGAGDSGKLAQLDSTGRWDVSMMPVGILAEVTVATASEALTAGNMVNLYSNSGTINSRKADATSVAKPADGFVLANVSQSANATVYRLSNTNTAVSSLTVGAVYFLDKAVAGGLTTDVSAYSGGNIVQRIGKTDSATSIVFDNCLYWVKA